MSKVFTLLNNTWETRFRIWRIRMSAYSVAMTNKMKNWCQSLDIYWPRYTKGKESKQNKESSETEIEFLHEEKNNQTVSKSFFHRQDCGYTLWFCQVIFLCRDERVHSVVQVWAVSDSFFPCHWQNMQTWLQKEKKDIKRWENSVFIDVFSLHSSCLVTNSPFWTDNDHGALTLNFVHHISSE